MDNQTKYDFVIFGANGFTGRRVVSEVQRISTHDNISWTVSGLNKSELLEVMELTGDFAQSICRDIIVADANDYQSLLAMCHKAKVVLDCVGPYRFLGEPVVKACIEAHTHYVDCCGEPQFLESMVLKYNDLAEKKGVYVVGSCGSVGLTDICVNFARQNFQGSLNSLKGFIELYYGSDGVVFHYPTYESAVQGLSDVNSLRKIRKELGYQRLPLVGPKVKLEGLLHYSPELKQHALPHIGAEVSVVRRTQRYIFESLNEPPVQYAMYVSHNSLWVLIRILFYALIVKLLAKIFWGKEFVLRHPEMFTNGIFTRRGPTKKQLEESRFSVTMFGEGYSQKSGTNFGRKAKPDKKIAVKLSGPELAYSSTKILMVQAALTLVKEQEHLPPRGGVYSPGAAFYKTRLIEKLQENGIKFEVL